MHIKYANQKEKKTQHSIASIFLGCRLNTVAAVFISLLVFTYVHLCFLYPNLSLCTRARVGGSFTNWDFFILLYYCAVQMYINGYCCVYRNDLT